MLHKNKKNRPILARIFIIISLLTLMIPVAPIASADLTCDGLNDSSTDTGVIVTILEEEIAAPTKGSADTLQVLSCARKTTCKEETKDIPKDAEKTKEEKDSGATKRTATVCESKYVDLSACNPSEEGVFCQKIQALYASSGINLLMSYLSLIYRWAAGIVGLISVVYLVIGGFMITAAQDDSAAIDKAKEKIMQSIAGLILLFLSAVILYTINPTFFNL